MGKTQERENRISRRAFLKVALISGAAMAAGLLLGSKLWTKPAPVPRLYPVGDRVVRIRPLGDDKNWALPSYTATDILNVIADLRPTTLNRYVSGPQNANGIVPVGSGQSPMSVLQFLQASLDNCKNPNPATMFNRLSLDYYVSSPDTFFQRAQSMYNLCQQLNPPQVLLSLDNWSIFLQIYTVNDAVNMTNNLYGMGWKGLAIGPCGAPQLPDGITSFSMICADPNTAQPDLDILNQLKDLQPSNKEFEVGLDFPGPMTTFSQLPPDQQADDLTNLVRQQAQYGYHYIYPIAQTFWDAKNVFTSASGKYGGISLYQVMKNLMAQYN